MEKSKHCCDPFGSHTKAICKKLRNVTEEMVQLYSFVTLTVGEKICCHCKEKLSKSAAAIVTESSGGSEPGPSSTATDVDSSDPNEPGPSRFRCSPRKRRAISQTSRHYEKAADKERKESARGSETAAETELRRGEQRDRQAAARGSETAAETELHRGEQRDRQAAARGSETAAETELCRGEQRDRQAAARGSETAAETEQRRNDDRVRHTARYAVNWNRRPASQKGHHGDEILAAVQIVQRNNVDSLSKRDGTPACKCPHCHAVKWANETKGMCCANGKVKLEAFKEHPEVFKALWEDQNDVEAKLFRKNIRQLNNALSLACLQVTQVQAPGGRWQPSVKIQGKVFVGMGPLLPQHQDAVVFNKSAVYVFVFFIVVSNLGMWPTRLLP